MILGIVMILVVAYVMFVSNPPYGDAFVHTFAPEHPMKLVLPIITLVGGTVGGYITFAGAHRILDSGIKGKQYLPFVNQSAIAGILTTGIMRTLLFLAVLGVVVTGVTLSSENPPASVLNTQLDQLKEYFWYCVICCSYVISNWLSIHKRNILKHFINHLTKEVI